MFELLKKKVSFFTQSVKEKIEEKEFSSQQPQVKLSTKTRIKRALGATILIEEKDVKNFLEELELSFLEADIEFETAKKIVNEIKKELIGLKIGKEEKIERVLRNTIERVLEKILKTNEIDILKLVNEKKPFIILFLGPNGHGKTTSIAKLSNFFKKNGKSVIWAASDTFRAASIEQLLRHAEKLNVRVVRHDYGADPAAVAFDAVKAAQAKKIDVVLIDTAGRQETNKNLMRELEKINRVIKPDLRVFVGEAMAGQSLLEVVLEYNKCIEIDAFILTKIDTDAKGGTLISILSNLKKPVLFIGTGQEYDDFERFSPKFLIERIL
jgi:fused signal recognition particle receptor